MNIKSINTCDHIAGTEATHYTRGACPKCNGSGILGDIDINNAGKINTVSNVDVLSLKILKILLEKKRSSGYGFDYSLLQDVSSVGIITSIKGEVVRCISYLQELQYRRERKGQFIKPQEKIRSIASLEVVNNDPRSLKITVGVNTYSNTVNVNALLRR